MIRVQKSAQIYFLNSFEISDLNKNMKAKFYALLEESLKSGEERKVRDGHLNHY